MDGHWGNYTKWNKTVTKGQMLHRFVSNGIKNEFYRQTIESWLWETGGTEFYGLNIW